MFNNFNIEYFKFGKHIGENIWWVIEIDPYYIIWCKNNIENFILTEEMEIALKYSLERLNYKN